MASNPSGPQGDATFVRKLAKILKDTDLTEIEVERGDLKIRVAREFPAAPAVHYAAAPAQAAPSPAPMSAPVPAAASAPEAAAADPKTHPGAVNSPMVGTCYLRPSPDADLFKKAGDAVKEGETILLIEAMKTFNPITAPKSGKLIEILVAEAQPVEYGEPLFIIG